MTVSALNVATQQQSDSDESYLPMTDEAEALRYQRSVSGTDYASEELDDDLNAAGWSSVVGSGGSAVTPEL